MNAAIPNKRKSNRERVLEVLSSGRQVHMRELNRITFRYGARIFELRRMGHNIETLYLADDETAYVMHPAKPVEAKQMALI